MKINIKKTHESAIIPSYAKDGDAGIDLSAVSRTFNDKERFWEYDTGIAIELPIGFVGLIFPRSSISKTDLVLTNCVGVIDSGYRGSIKARFKVSDNYDHSLMPKIYEVGDRICQLIIMPIPKIQLIEVNSLSDTERGQGGFGHTGK